MKKYGNLYYEKETDQWIINNAEPHMCIKLKAIFEKIPKQSPQPFKFSNLPDVCFDLLWFCERYPLQIEDNDLKRLKQAKKNHVNYINDLERILLPEYKPTQPRLKEGKKARNYQLQFSELVMKCKRIINGDDIGLGKTVEAMLVMLNPQTLPALVTVQTHMPKQWKEAIEDFTHLRVHIIKGTKPYNLPEADIYITKYSCLAGWSNFFETKFYKSCFFDEIQELRHAGTAKYESAMILSNNCEYAVGLSASPIYNYVIEIYNIVNVIKNGALGDPEDFMREWIKSWGSKSCKDPQALGAYLQEIFLLVRRTRKDVNRELPPVNKIIHTVPFDEKEVEKAEEIAKKLALKATQGSFVERGQAARELDILMRHTTGVAKARGVAEYVKILLENNIPIILAGWHRDVYDIWLEELKEFNPVMYTGSETPAQKEKSKNAFINGETNLFIISLRSGVGLDGLQKRCRHVVIGELDWSPKVHDQIIGRADREDEEQQNQGVIEQKEGVTAIYLVTDAGSDPLIVDLLGLKSSQSHGVMNPFADNVEERFSDDSRITLLAKQFLEKKGIC